MTKRLNTGLELAKLHSKAVDYAKNGEPARMPQKLLPKRWPHFMEKRTKNQYRSQTALGKLYDRIELVNFVPEYDTPFDERILGAFDIQKEMLESASKIKIRYDDAVRRIMTQHEIATEFEIWSTFVMYHAKQRKDFKFHEEIGQLATALKDTYREECYEKAGGRDFEKIGPFVAAMYLVTCGEMTRALHNRHSADDGRNGAFHMPLMSFPWLFPNVLGNIATGRANGATVPILPPKPPPLISIKKQPLRPISPEAVPPEEDVLQTRDGITHRGEMLSLFHHTDHTNGHQRPEKGEYDSSDGDSGEVVFLKPVKQSPYELLASMNRD